MTKQPLRVSTILGVGALCMTLAVAPIASGFLSSNVSAAGGPSCSYGSDDYSKAEIVLNSWKAANNRFTTETFKDLADSIKTLPKYERYVQFENIFNSFDPSGGDAGEAALATLKSEIADLGFELQDFLPEYYSESNLDYLDFVIYTIKNSDEYKNNAELRAVVAKARAINQSDIDKLVAAALALNPNITFEGIVTSSDVLDIINAPYSESDWSTKGYSEYANYSGLLFLNETIEQAIKNNTPNSNALGLDASRLYFETFCYAKQINPKFEVQHKLAADPLIDLINPWASSEDNTDNSNSDNNNDSSSNTNTPSTSDKPSNGTIENKENGVKVSGININVSYTLNVNLVPSADLKLTGDGFKNSINQAFYDIFIRDSQNNVISNTGKVEVSIKLPSNMSAKSDFVVYYVPTAANGEYLTDKAQAIKGVKVTTDGWLTFETDHFSVYGIVEYPKHTAPNTGVVAQHESSAVVTGAKIAAGIVSVLTAAGAAIVVHRQVLRKKANQNQE